MGRDDERKPSSVKRYGPGTEEENDKEQSDEGSAEEVSSVPAVAGTNLGSAGEEPPAEEKNRDGTEQGGGKGSRADIGTDAKTNAWLPAFSPSQENSRYGEGGSDEDIASTKESISWTGGTDVEKYVGANILPQAKAGDSSRGFRGGAEMVRPRLSANMSENELLELNELPTNNAPAEACFSSAKGEMDMVAEVGERETRKTDEAVKWSDGSNGASDISDRTPGGCHGSREGWEVHPFGGLSPSTETASEDVVASRPGAYPSAGRAIGALPVWGRRAFASLSRSIGRTGLPAPTNNEDDIQLEAVVVNDDELKEAIRQRILADAVQADVIEVERENQSANDKCHSWHSRKLLLVCLFFVILLLPSVIGVSVFFGVRSVHSYNVERDGTNKPMLETLTQRGVLRCGVDEDTPGFSTTNEETGEMTGFDVDLCRAVAAAVLGKSFHLEAVPVQGADRFSSLEKESVDILVKGSTHTLERDVYETTARVGFSFSVPYMYTGLSFGGIPQFQKCAEDMSTTGDCAGLKVCVLKETTWMERIQTLLPGSSIVPINNFGRISDVYEGLKNGLCNVIVGEQLHVAEAVLRENEYLGAYRVGKKFFSKEPLAIVTRDNDPQWSDFVSWVLQGLMKAEELNITQRTAHKFTLTKVFGHQFQNMFRNALDAAGNYGEIYTRNLNFLPRHEINLLNSGDTGLIYSHPFGRAQRTGPGPILGGHLERITKRGHLRCGIMSRSGFGELDNSTGEWRGLDVDFCCALSASIFKGTYDTVVFVDIPWSGARFRALADGDVDVLSGISVNFQVDVHEPTSGKGFSFSQPYFYGRIKSGEEVLALATQQDDAQWSAFVYWVVTSTFYAEENGFTQTLSNEMPLVNLFGPGFSRMFRDTIVAVGNYGEMYERNIGALIPRAGRNMLNADPIGPQHYPLPISGS